MPDQISTPIIKKRCEKIRKLGIRKKIAFYQSLIGKELDVLIEEEKKARSKMIKGVSSNYVPVLINSDEALKNKIIKVKIKDVVIDQSKTPAIYCLGIY